MTTLREAAQQFVADYENGDLGDLKHYARALRAALAQEEQEPAIYPDEAREMGLEEVALYTYPPCREWHSLTDKEIRRMGIETPGQQGGWNLAFARAIEAKLKEKNA